MTNYMKPKNDINILSDRQLMTSLLFSNNYIGRGHLLETALTIRGKQRTADMFREPGASFESEEGRERSTLNGLPCRSQERCCSLGISTSGNRKLQHQEFNHSHLR